LGYYSGVLAEQFTWPGLALVLLGAWIGVRRAPGPTAICLLFAVPLFWLLCGQVVHFKRNMLPLVGPLSVLFVVGAQGVVAWLCLSLERWPWYRQSAVRWQRGVRWGLAVLLGCGWFVSGPA